MLERVPGLNRQSLTGAMSYTDALTDDCRLVVRAILEAARHGGVAQNYCRVEQAMADGDKFAITVTDRTSGQTATLSSRRVVSATGAWADRFSGSDPRVRPLRGSHLFVDPERLPVKDCLTVMHPDDGRPVFVFPWEGVTCVGTTDLDHPQDMDIEAAASGQEVDYLLRLINSQFPDVKLDRKDIYATIAGVRPVIASGKGLDPSKERRDRAVVKTASSPSVRRSPPSTDRPGCLACHRLIDSATHRRGQKSRTRLYAHQRCARSRGCVPPCGQGDPDFIQWILITKMWCTWMT